MAKENKIFVKPAEGLVVNFKSENRRIPKNGAEVVNCIYYRKMILEGSLLTPKSKVNNSANEGEK